MAHTRARSSLLGSNLAASKMTNIMVPSPGYCYLITYIKLTSKPWLTMQACTLSKGPNSLISPSSCTCDLSPTCSLQTLPSSSIVIRYSDAASESELRVPNYYNPIKPATTDSLKSPQAQPRMTWNLAMRVPTPKPSSCFRPLSVFPLRRAPFWSNDNVDALAHSLPPNIYRTLLAMETTDR